MFSIGNNLLQKFTMNTPSPLVSVIIPLYNARAYIGECINSVLEQTYHPIEVIVVDDGSTDTSADFVETHYGSHVRLVRQENQGASAARNHGLDVATGDYIQFLDADDTMAYNKIASEMMVLERAGFTGTDVVFCQWNFMEDGTTGMKSVTHDYDRAVDALVECQLQGCGIYPHCYLTPRKLIQKAGRWDETLTLTDDSEFFARVLAKADRLLFAPNTFVLYRRGTPGSLSKQKSDHDVECLMRGNIAISEIIEASRHPKADEAVKALLGNLLRITYPYYPKQRKLAEAYLQQRFPGYEVFYPRLNWKEWLCYWAVRLKMIKR